MQIKSRLPLEVVVLGILLIFFFAQSGAQETKSESFQAQKSQELKHEAVAINIEMPVRVFQGDTFIDNLTIDDFEIYDNDRLQKIDALYLIKKDEIKRKQEPKPQRPQTSRYFVLSFVLTEYIPRLNIAIDYFFDEVFKPDDTLALVTPIKTHHLNLKAFQSLPREKIKKEILGLLRKDILLGNTEYKNLLEYISSFATLGDESNYMMAVDRLEALRYINQTQLIEFSPAFSGTPLPR